MRIGEIAKKSGISISNIRFYEKKGLIEPDREVSSQYRNYTEEDLERIKLIILYRKMDFSVEQIESILKGDISLEEALSQQIETLEEKQKEIQGSIDLCHKLVSDGAVNGLDVDYYMNYTKQEEASGKRFANIDVFIEDVTEFTNVPAFSDFLLPGGLELRFVWLNRLIMIFWSILLFGMPIFGVIDLLIRRDFNIALILFMVLWMAFFWTSFIKFRKAKKVNEEHTIHIEETTK